jgi:1,2-diacylglycerol 3-beta-glucosyltransferase
MIAASILIAIVAVVLLLPAVSDLLSLARIALGRPRRRSVPDEAPHLLFLVPAHNEELLIESCITSVTTQRYPRWRYDVVVIADNCTDRTGDLARAAGARCLERHEPDRPGKPRAIAWALARLPVREYDAVVIVDADTIVNAEFADAVAQRGPLAGKAVQPYNDVRNPADNALTRMAAVFAAARYRGAFLLKRRAGLNIPLSAGMCLGSDVIAASGWTTFSLSEDWEWYARLTVGGVPIDFTPEAHIYAQETRGLRQSASQRRRWMTGKLAVLRDNLRALLVARRITLSQKLDAVAELTALGPAMHLALVTLTSLLAWLVNLPGAAALTAALAASLVRPTVYTLIALAGDPEPFRAMRAFAFLPVYAIWRLAVAVASVRMAADRPWIRTERHPHTRAGGALR